MSEAGGRPARYDSIGRGYARARIPDPRIATQIHAALGDARRVVNVGAFDAALATLTLHHWSDLAAGIAELRRVAPRIVAFTFDVATYPWIATEYLPEMIDQVDFNFPPIDDVAAMLDAAVQVVPVPHDCTDGFTGAYWARPEAYLDPDVRAGMSAMQTLGQDLVESRMDRLATDLASGAWDERHGHLRGLDELDLGYRLLVTR